MKRIVLRHGAILGLWTALVTVGIAADPAVQVDPQAKKVLDEFAAFNKEVQGFRVETHAEMILEQMGQRQQEAITQTWRAQRPNLLTLANANPEQGAVASDGKELLASRGDAYAVEPAPATWSELAENMAVRQIAAPGNASTVIDGLLTGEGLGKALDRLNATYIGREVLDGVECHRLRLSDDSVALEYWIEAGPKPLVRKLVPDLQAAIDRQLKAQFEGKMPADLPAIKVTMTITFKDWEIDPKFPADAFATSVPKGAEKVDSFEELFGAPKPAPSPLLGKPAPAVKLELADGGQFDLAELKDKNIVILDFWATWCGPCVMAMPVMEEVAGKYREQGVRLYAVNLQESAEEVLKFLEAKELHMPVPLDKDGEVAAAYGVTGIPQTVIIGRDGTVQVVHIGFSESLSEELSKELEALLAGRDLAAETLEKAKKKSAPAGD